MDGELGTRLGPVHLFKRYREHSGLSNSWNGSKWKPSKLTCIDVDVLDQHLLLELNVDQMRLRSVRLPVGLEVVVSQLIDAKACGSIGEKSGALVTVGVPNSSGNPNEIRRVMLSIFIPSISDP